MRASASGPRRRIWVVTAIVLAVAAAVIYEVKTSALESTIISHIARRATYAVQPGPSERIVFPRPGPLDDRLGYAHLPEFQQHLDDAGFTVQEQAVFSPELERLARWGITPPYRVAAPRGLVIEGQDGTPIYDARPTEGIFVRYEDIPDLVVRALLYTENRELGETTDPRANPVIEWDRMAMASLSYAASKTGLPVHIQGGSTLVTQMEKYRHSMEGSTHSPFDKLRQMAAASLWVYRMGPDTRERRHEIIVDYINTVPLSAAPGYGEVHGLGEGMRVWFGRTLEDLVSDLRTSQPEPVRARAFKQAFTLLCAARAPSDYLLRDHAALERRVDYQVAKLAETGVITPSFAKLVRETPVEFASRPRPRPARSFVEAKSSNAIRTRLMRTLELESLYELDRLDLDVRTTLDPRLQADVEKLFTNLKDPDFLRANGLVGEHLLSTGNPDDVLYSFLLFERTRDGNALRAIADNLDQPLDLNYGMKLELGSTAKFRTLAHYLEVMETLHHQFARKDGTVLARAARDADDPLTAWAAGTLALDPRMTINDFLSAALDRRYSGSPGETFFTGGGAHTFRNFDPDEDGRTNTVREGLTYSLNLVYIRLMRDLVRYHEARLPYDTRAVLDDLDNPDRKRLLTEIADAEARQTLARAWFRYRGQPADSVFVRLLGTKATAPRERAILFFAWHHGADQDALWRWLASGPVPVAPEEARRLARAYGNPDLTISDYGYLLNRHPLEVWCAGEVVARPDLTWKDLLARSHEARLVSSAWLFDKHNRRAQDLRLRIRFEQDAFAAMTPDWRRLGFPFERLVPSYATAIGSSSDRPGALAELMGIVVNDGVKKPSVYMRQLRFAEATPYQTVMDATTQPGERVMSPEVAKALRAVLADVVAKGTARRVAGAFQNPDGTPMEIGGKTGSGDNRFKTFSKGGGLVSSRAVNRTATFVFEAGGRYFGVLTAFVPGEGADDYGFTSALPVAILKVLAPSIDGRESAGTAVVASAAPAHAGGATERTAAQPAPVPASGTPPFTAEDGEGSANDAEAGVTAAPHSRDARAADRVSPGSQDRLKAAAPENGTADSLGTDAPGRVPPGAPDSLNPGTRLFP